MTDTTPTDQEIDEALRRGGVIPASYLGNSQLRAAFRAGWDGRGKEE